MNNGTTLIISHQERILKIADEIILMKNGKVVMEGKADEVLNEMNIGHQCCKINKKQCNRNINEE